MFVANRGTEDEWSCDCCDPDGFHHHDDSTCEHVCCEGWDGYPDGEGLLDEKR